MALPGVFPGFARRTYYKIKAPDRRFVVMLDTKVGYASNDAYAAREAFRNGVDRNPKITVSLWEGDRLVDVNIP